MDTETKITELETRLTDLERKLKSALQQDQPVEVPLELRGSLVSTFKGEMLKFAVLAWGLIIFFAFGAVAGGFLFFSCEPQTQNGGFLLFIVSILMTVLVKLWYWQIWNRYSVVREIKRLELRIVELTDKLQR